jgi:SagB-type dehydrogenase family enzyme
MLQFSPTVRIYPPSLLNDRKWIVEDIFSHRRFALPELATIILIGFMKASTSEDIAHKVQEKSGKALETINHLIENLQELSLVLPVHEIENNTYLRWFVETYRTWQSYNWIEAAEYHLATYDYKFYGANVEGFEEASHKMRAYSASEPDTNRFKYFESPLETLDMPPLNKQTANVPVYGASGSADKTGGLTLETLMTIASCALGVVIETKIQWEGVPIIRRTSPSGGSRHPTEGYIAVINVPNMRQGWYYVLGKPLQLQLIKQTIFSPQMLKDTFIGFERAPFTPAAIFVLTTVFERNMYRYREPRTFRTVHLDAGHLATTLEFVANALHVKSFVHYGADEQRIEAELGLHNLQEGFQLSVSLG